MILSDISVKRPVFATVISLLIVILGVASLRQLPVREYPNIDPPIVSISTTYQGAAPEVVNNEITEIIERGISGVDGIRDITSQSREGRSQTTIQFHLSADVDAAANDVRDAVSRVLNQLPEDADTPIVAKADADARPMMWITLTSDRYSAVEVSDYAERHLIDRLAVLDGVAQVRIGGQRRYAMRVWLNRQSMAAHGIVVADVENALRRNNVELPAGRVESQMRDLSVRTDSRLNTPEEFERLVITYRDGAPIRIGDIARVETGIEDDTTSLRANGVTAIGVGIIRQSQANTITVADLVRAEVALIEPTLPDGIHMRVNYDESQFIRASIREVIQTLLIAIGLVVAVIFLFLRNLRATFIPAVTIPVAITGAFILMAPLGFSVNVLTLLALLLAIGLVVDDAIVVLENVQRRIDEGEPPLLAAYRGTRQVAFAVIATTATLVAVFVPLAFMEGNVGRLFTEFGLALAAAVIFSSIVALTLTPMLCSKWLHNSGQQNAAQQFGERALELLASGYRWTLRKALAMPVVVISVAVLLSLSAYQLMQILPQELTPTEDRGVFMIPSSAPKGSTLEATDASLREIEEIIMPLLESGEVERMLTVLGTQGNTDSAFTIVGLAPWSERSRSQQEVVAEVMPQLMAIPGLRAFAINPPGLGQSGFSSPVQFVIGGPDYETLRDWSERIVDRASENPRLLNLNTDYEETRPQLGLQIDRQRAADLGVPISEISRVLQTMLASRPVTTYLDRGREYDVMLQAERAERASPQDLGNIFVRSETTGALVPLSGLLTLDERGAPPSLNRIDRMPAVTISASLAPGYDLGTALAYMNQIAAEELPPEARISYSGLSDEFQRAGGAILVTFGLALLIVYLVLAAQFESFIHPFVIMTSVPLAITGALASLWLTGISLNIYSQIGMILLIGLMAKNGILIVEFANQLRDTGMSVREAIVEGAVLRLRPVLMTAISTVFGALPLIMATGAGAESRAAIGVVIIGGLSFASVLTLYLTPVLYDLLARFTRPAGAVAQDLEKLAQERPDRPAASANS
ncbi:multidrug transporter AcrB [Alkalilimnicola ehrlichii]|uniref:Multidrug transporter AcrB n=1 Tax=Alkalilimnicola ehrlichii TaxID=351052 RepID=A0A3E0X3A5_9GAMM|nr:efflux RND transporter permease subunit [Alkalilimnicola ehrlichii]RFA31022.1 multidrug transporter AcrB [Alkalilimnicola ehrlichii]RFA38975.1 multidrug transporter AcrB [Alkalilimnicola ehrlichii]